VPALRHLPWKALCAAALLALLGALGVGALPWQWLSFHDAAFSADPLIRARGDEHLEVVHYLIGLGLNGLYSLVLLLCGIWALLVRRPSAHRALDVGFALIYIGIFCGWYALFGHLLGQAEAAAVAAGVEDRSDLAYEAFLQSCRWLWPLLPLSLLLAWWQIHLHRAHVYAAYRKPIDPVLGAAGERLVESIRSGGHDRRFRRSWLGSSTLHLAVVLAGLITLPSFCKFKDLKPLGRGSPAVPMAVAVEVKKPKKVLLLAVDSPFIFDMPDIEDSKVVKEIQKKSEKQYQTTSAGTPGAMGEGGGTEGGWPDGDPNGVLNFYYLKYADSGWDDGLGAARGNAVKNFLAKFKSQNSIKFKVASDGLPITVGQLGNFEKGYQPAFVFMTGIEGSIRTTSAEDAIIREYCQDGGMIFADCGSPAWHKAFTSWAARVFRGNPLKVIEDSDPIFQRPFRFEHGVDPHWHHGGTEALGIRGANQRWMVFYHPGDVKDCWKDDAHRIPKHTRDNAFQIGYNIIYYSMTRYLEETRKYRKK
jgi:Domain of unknown function (DUF4159)